MSVNSYIYIIKIAREIFVAVVAPLYIYSSLTLLGYIPTTVASSQHPPLLLVMYFANVYCILYIYIYTYIAIKIYKNLYMCVKGTIYFNSAKSNIITFTLSPAHFSYCYVIEFRTMHFLHCPNVINHRASSVK